MSKYRLAFSIALFLASLATAAVDALVQYREETAVGGQWSQPRLILVNTGSEVLSAPTVLYRFRVESGKTPVLQDFYSPDAQITLDTLGDGLYQVRIAYSTLQLAPGLAHASGEGVYFGLRNSDWSTWNFDDDPSYRASGRALIVNDGVEILVGDEFLYPPTYSASVAVFPSSACDTHVLYDGDTALHADFYPYDWPEPYELLTNHGVLGGGLLQPYYLRMSGAKSVTDDWRSVYRFGGEVDFGEAAFAMSLYSDASREWGFRLVDVNNNYSGQANVMVQAGTGIRLHWAWSDFPAGAADSAHIVGIEMGPLAVPAQAYSHNFLDDLELSCGTLLPNSSSSSMVSSSSSEGTSSSSDSSSSVWNYRIHIYGQGSTDPVSGFTLAVGQSQVLQFIPSSGYRLSSVLLDSQPLEVSNSQWTAVGDGAEHDIYVTFEGDPGGMRVLRVVVGEHGSASLEGTFLVSSGSQYSIQTFPDPGYRLTGVVVNGVAQALPSDGAVAVTMDQDRTLYVEFSARLLSQLIWDVTGPGQGLVADSSLTYQGETRVLLFSADSGAYLRNLVVDGASQVPAPSYILGPLGPTHEIAAEFRTLSTCPAIIETEHSVDVNSRVNLRIQAIQTLVAPWGFDYVFRAASGKTPVFEAWYLPDADYAVEPLGLGFYRIRVSVHTALADSETYAAQFGLRYSDYSPWISRWEWSAAGSADAYAVNTHIPLRLSDSSMACGSYPVIAEHSYDDSVSVQALYFDEGLSTEVLRPRILIENTGNVPISDFYALYFFTVSDGRIPQLEDWYSPNVQVSLVAYGNGLYAIRYDFTGVTLLPGESIPNGGSTVMGIHFVDWGAQDRSDDWSHYGNNTQSYVVDPNIPIFDRWGHLLSGNLPKIDGDGGDGDSTGGLVISRQPQDLSLEEGTSGSFSVVVLAPWTLHYHWLRDGVYLSDSSSTLMVGPVTLADDGSWFQVEIWDSFGHKLMSDSAQLSVHPVGVTPLFLVQPEDRTVREGDSTCFVVSAFSPTGASLSFSWTRNGQNAGSGDTLCLTAVPLSWDSSRVQATVSDGSSQVLSSAALLHVLPRTQQAYRLTLSGVLTDSSGLVDGRENFTVRLFASATGGSPLYVEKFWRREGLGISVSQGVWTLQLGAGNSSQNLARVAQSRDNLFAEILVGPVGHQQIVGDRVPLHAVARSHVAAVAKGAGTPDYPAVSGSMYLDTLAHKYWFRTRSGWMIQP